MEWNDELHDFQFAPPGPNTVNPHTGGRAPFGIHDRKMPGANPGWDWYSGARGGRWNSVDPGKTATAVNGVIGHIEGGLNYKVEVRSMEVWFRRPTGWFRAYTSAPRDSALIFGSYKFVRDYGHGGGMTEELGTDGACRFSMRAGMWAHFYCRNNGSGMPARCTLPRDFQRLHVRAQYRLVGADASTAIVVGRAGADYFITASQSAPADDVQPSVFCARHRFIDENWRWYGATTMYPAELLAGNAPPEPGAYVPPEEPEEPPENPDNPVISPPVRFPEPAPPDPRRTVFSRFGKRCRDLESELPVEGA